MAETTTTVENNGQQEKAPVQWGPHASTDEARKAPVERKGWALFQVTDPDGNTAFAWAMSLGDAIAKMARSKGWAACSAGKAPTKDKVAGLLAALPAADRAALIAQYFPAKAKAGK